MPICQVKQGIPCGDVTFVVLIKLPVEILSRQLNM